MTEVSMGVSPAIQHVRAGTTALLLLALTSVHHAYGAAVYETPWRLHIVYIAVPVAMAILLALYIGLRLDGRPAGRLATWIGIAVILAFPVAAIGFCEGGYNHIVKNIVYFGFGRAEAIAMFPPPTAELPNDLVFELTGIAQFPVSVLTAIAALGLLRRTRR
jgi:hypothetical protein